MGRRGTALKQKTSMCAISDLQYLSNGSYRWELRLQTGKEEKLLCAEILSVEQSLSGGKYRRRMELREDLGLQAWMES